MLRVPAADFAQLIEQRGGVIDVAFLIDVVAALVREFAIDPQWLLTGTYDSGLHRRALAYGEDRNGADALRALIREQYQRMRANS